MSNRNGDKKKNASKRTSPFRIKVGCVVALRYRPGGHQIQLEGADGRIIDCGEEKEGNLNGTYVGYREPVSSAHFSEVWTDPLPGHDDGLALIGSRIRCFFPKTVLSEPYNATSQLLGGEIVNIVNYCEEQYSKRRDQLREGRKSDGILVDLLVDNKGDRLKNMFPFLQRIDPVITQEKIAAMSKSERRSFRNEERIKGGSDKAIVRVWLNDEVSSGLPLNRRTKEHRVSRLQAKWAIRKRVPAKIFRQVQNGCRAGKTSKSKSAKQLKENDIQELNGASQSNLPADREPVNGNENGRQSDEDDIKDSHPPEEERKNEPLKKRRKVMTTNKDFSSSRYLGDGNDSVEQQEANWRWQAAKYNPFSVLAERPLSKGLLQRMCYNIVGEVIRIQPELSSEAKTLATVTIRCLVLPEHTLSGRLSQHGQYDMFDMLDLSSNAFESEDEDPTISSASGVVGKGSSKMETLTGEIPIDSCFLRVPIEDLVIVRRKVSREPKTERPASMAMELTIRQSYSFYNDTYFTAKETISRGEENGPHDFNRCHRCRQETALAVIRSRSNRFLCQSCVDFLKHVRNIFGMPAQGANDILCDCGECAASSEVNLLEALSEEVHGSVSKLGGTLQELGNFASLEDSGFIATRFIAKGMSVVDFAYNPHSLGLPLYSSSSKFISKVTVREPRKGKKLTPTNIIASAQPKPMNLKKNDKKHSMRLKGIRKAPAIPMPKKEVFRPTSARTLTYDEKNRRFDASATDLFQWKLAHCISASREYPELPRNHRAEANPFNNDPSDAVGGNQLLGRAARANQRRLVKSIAAMGVNVDTLAGREQQLRFDRSGIHDWGVFVDIDVREGDMIVEYRGVVIGNAMAEKREKEYHEAKLGSDYMFRIDELSVCDATKQGNVARFINASCDPNCYTKIISLDGMKRIVIYAKRDIKAGEELCYDYKFAFEPDPTKRIPCHCGAQECRGFLNWDKRLADSEKLDASFQNQFMKNASTTDHPDSAMLK
ncbi:SET methyltransferase domain containing protein [Nitzschia inconspicua]|uniref:[histone H3]-lysine(4) N-trimethyltransferase n=1 Tax=Nitzschia inconspicua TaxID=303405 RepID=A0A9K3LLH5_9STRA|nr:SET methyltransferase domain containing protein [Nitzschia inconspicua]